MAIMNETQLRRIIREELAKNDSKLSNLKLGDVIIHNDKRYKVLTISKIYVETHVAWDMKGLDVSPNYGDTRVGIAPEANMTDNGLGKFTQLRAFVDYVDLDAGKHGCVMVYEFVTGAREWYDFDRKNHKHEIDMDDVRVEPASDDEIKSIKDTNISFNLKTGNKKEFIARIKKAIVMGGGKPGKVDVARSNLDSQNGTYGDISVTYTKDVTDDEYGNEYAIVFSENDEEYTGTIDSVSIQEPDGNTDASYSTWTALVEAIKSL